MMTFDREFARLMLEICRYTYAATFDDAKNAQDKEDALRWIEKVGGIVDTPKILKGSNTSFACIAAYPDKNIVSYMGTTTQFDTYDNAMTSIKDWLKNFDILLVPFEMPESLSRGSGTQNLGGLVHKGFLEELQAVHGQVINELENTGRGGRSRPVYLTGHSQGGAEAALSTRALLAGGFPVVSTYTFAAPRPGNAEFVKTIPETFPFHRIEFGDDIVPHVPPAMISNAVIPGLSETVKGLKTLPFVSEDARTLLNFIQQADQRNSFRGAGKLCYGSWKSKGLRTDMSAEEESELFQDRLWSLVRHPDHWVEHHHLAGTTQEVLQGSKGNYTALVSRFPIVV